MKATPTIITQQYHFEELTMQEQESDPPSTNSGASNFNIRPSGGGSRLGIWKPNDSGNGTTGERMSISHYRADNLEQGDVGNCWLNPPDQPWSPGFYLSERGLDNIHIYFWITKDFCWVQSLLIPGILIGSLAVLYAIFLSFRAIYWRRNIGEFWIKFSEFLWLFANFWWMIGEIHDDHYGYFNTTKSIVDKHTQEAGIIFIVTMVWISLYYLILKPLKLLEETQEEKNDPTALNPRFSFFFKSWTEYEHIHIFFWVGKDTAWNWWIRSMWLVFFIPTLLIGLDFVILTMRSKRLMIDHAHYFAQYMWVLANAVWAGGEFWFTPNNDSAIPVGRFSSEARHTSRWYSSWVVLGAYIPLVALYVLWIYYTYFGVIPPMTKKNGGPDTDHNFTGDNEVYDDRDSYLSSGTSSMVVNPLVPMREVNIQPSSDYSESSSTPSNKDSFKIRSSGLSKGDYGNDNGDANGDQNIRMSDLSDSNSIIHGAEV